MWWGVVDVVGYAKWAPTLTVSGNLRNSKIRSTTVVRMTRGTNAHHSSVVRNEVERLTNHAVAEQPSLLVRILPATVILLTAAAIFAQMFVGFEVSDVDGRIKQICEPLGDLGGVVSQGDAPLTQADLACLELRMNRQAWLGVTVISGAAAWAVTRKLSQPWQRTTK